MKLIHDNKTEYVLLVPEKKDVFIEFAIKTLNDVMEKSTGVKFAVVEKTDKKFISLGNTYALKSAKIKTSYGDDGLAVKEVDGNLYLFGQSEYGPIWAVYEFLERTVGYKFYTIDEIKIENRTEIDISGLDVEYTPSFAHRGSGFGVARDNKEYATGLKAYSNYLICLYGKDFKADYRGFSQTNY